MSRKSKLIILTCIVLLLATFIQLSRLQVLEQLFNVGGLNNFEYKVPEYIDAKVPSFYQKVILVYQNDYDQSLKVQAEQVLSLAKFQYQALDIGSGEFSSVISKLGKNDLVVFATENHLACKEPEVLKTFIKNGGSVTFLVRSNDPTFFDVSGIKSSSGYIDDLTGLKIEEALYPGIMGYQTDSAKFTHSSILVTLDERAKVLISHKRTPLAWYFEVGEGHVNYMNSTMLSDKANRGVLLAMITYGQAYIVQGAFDIFLMNIDDFPAPIRRGQEENILKEYSLNNLQFYKEVWLPSMFNLAKKYKFKYTGLIIGTYTDAVKAPFDALSEQERADLLYFGRKLDEARGELGIHGLNHQPLVLEEDKINKDLGYTPWESKQDMIEGLLKLKEEIKKAYGDITLVTYVPPSNTMSETGMDALLEVFPTIRVIAGLYTGSEIPGIVYQEVGEDKVFKGVYNLPRFSAGYLYSEETEWDVLSALYHVGMFNHFVHPDDLLDSDRHLDNKWRDMYSSLEDMVREVKTLYPYIESQTDFEAYLALTEYEKLSIYSYKVDDVITIVTDKFSKTQTYLLRLGKQKVVKVDGGSYIKLDAQGLYAITIENTEVKVTVKD